MKPPFPSVTTTWHNDTYAAISPSRSELSVAGKSVIITGAVWLYEDFTYSRVFSDTLGRVLESVGRQL